MTPIGDDLDHVSLVVTLAEAVPTPSWTSMTTCSMLRPTQCVEKWYETRSFLGCNSNFVFFKLGSLGRNASMRAHPCVARRESAFQQQRRCCTSQQLSSRRRKHGNAVLAADTIITATWPPSASEHQQQRLKQQQECPHLRTS